MIEKNKKRYVYLDKYLEAQESVRKKLDRMDVKMNLITFVVLGLIFATTYALYKIFG
jgi:hypothetical protein